MSNAVFAHAVYGWRVELTEAQYAEFDALLADAEKQEDFVLEGFPLRHKSAEGEPAPLQAWADRIMAELLEKYKLTSLRSHPSLGDCFCLHVVSADADQDSQTPPGSFLAGFGLMSFPGVFTAEDRRHNAWTYFAKMKTNKADWHTWVI